MSRQTSVRILENTTMHLLDNPIWSALTTQLAHFAQTEERARRFPPQVTALAAVADETPESYASLDRLLSEAPAGLFLHRLPEFPPQWSLIRTLPLWQMVFEDGRTVAPRHAFTPLEKNDAREMLALAELTKPGPFGLRTHELGNYLGVREQGKLIAMAGERLRVPGFAEISAVCTHPDHLGHGYATSLIAELVQRIHTRGEIPFLHVAEENERAIALYERLGFRKRHRFQLAVIQRAKNSAAA